MLGAAFQPEHYDVTKESRLTCATVNTYPSHMRALGTSILPSASKMCIFSSLLLEKNSTWKLVTLLDGSKPFFLSLSKYLLYDTYIYISIYILQKKKKRQEEPAVTIYFTVYHMPTNDRRAGRSVHRDSGQEIEIAVAERHTRNKRRFTP